MRTYPLYRPDGSLRGFEITSTWLWMGSLLKLLCAVPGITDVKRQWFNEDRVAFKFHGIEGVVNEPWGDNSRYWVGLRVPDASPEVEIEPIHEAFKRYRGFLAATIWPIAHHDG